MFKDDEMAYRRVLAYVGALLGPECPQALNPVEIDIGSLKLFGAVL